ncbi:MAG TPA: hypothetical protein VJB96_00540 [Patescibacteria group bacterium]|nr:hypothetical protein [Patescibacteria group bacterium]
MEKPHIKEPETEEEAAADIHPLTPFTKTLITEYVAGLEFAKKPGTPIHVDEIASHIAKFYEQVRKVIDWKEDNVLRRSAIERALKRTLFPKLTGVSLKPNIDSYRVAYSVTADLIRGGHLPNDEIPEEHVTIVQAVLDKYLYILKHAVFPTQEILPIKRQINFTYFIIELAAVDIEEILTNPVKERVLLEAMTQTLTDRIRIQPEGGMSDEDKKTHVFIAASRTLFDLDDSFIIAQLLKFSYPNWLTPDETLRTKLATDIPAIWENSHKVLEHPVSRQLYTICERVDAVYMLLGDVLDSNKESPKKVTDVFSDKILLKEAISHAYDKRYVSLKTRLFRLAIFSTLSVFLSNWVTFYIVEVPMASLFYEGFNLFTAIIDFVVPTVVMFTLVSIIRPPPAENIQRVLTAVYQFVYDDEKRKLYDVYLKRKKNPMFTLVVGTLYLIMMFGVLGGVGYVFYIAGLPITSVIFDTFTIALTFFAAVGIRNKSKELSVDDKTPVWEFLLDMLSVPIARIGAFLAAKWKEYNIVAILFTFLIETPMVVIFDFIENWSQYIKERRAELH